MRILVLTSEPISADQLRGALPGGIRPEEAEVMVVAPALQESGIRFWMSDADEAIAEADEVRRQSVEQLGEQGVSASGQTGESDPLQAIQDALQTFAADRIVLFRHAGDEQSFREDIEPSEIEDRFRIPVDHASI